VPEFARDFFGRLRAECPVLPVAVFLRWSVQPDDVYGFFDCSPGFVVQVDPHLEYIIVFGGSGRGEYGDWDNNDRTPEAVSRVGTEEDEWPRPRTLCPPSPQTSCRRCC
jgi:hypothetical protein